MNFLRSSSQGRCMVIFLIIGWSLFTFFSYQSEWQWNSLATIAGAVMVFCTFLFGIIIGKELQIFQSKRLI